MVSFHLLLIVCCSGLLEIISGSGFIEIQLLKYENPDKKDANDNCCRPACRDDCKNIFNICLDNSTFPYLNKCSYGEYTSQIIDDDDLEFKDNKKDKNLAKPYKFKFEKWEGDAQIQVKANIGHERRLIVKFDVFQLRARPAAYGSTAYKSQNFNYKRKGIILKRLELQYKIECEPEYIPPLCFRKPCTPKDDPVFGHYKCSKTGDKICLPGWFKPDSNCTTSLESAQIIFPSSFYPSSSNFQIDIPTIFTKLATSSKKSLAVAISSDIQVKSSKIMQQLSATSTIPMFQVHTQPATFTISTTVVALRIQPTKATIEATTISKIVKLNSTTQLMTQTTLTTVTIQSTQPTTISETTTQEPTSVMKRNDIVKYSLIGSSLVLLSLLITAVYFLFQRKIKQRQVNPEESSSTEEAISMNDSLKKIMP